MVTLCVGVARVWCCVLGVVCCAWPVLGSLVWCGVPAVMGVLGAWRRVWCLGGVALVVPSAWRGGARPLLRDVRLVCCVRGGVVCLVWGVVCLVWCGVLGVVCCALCCVGAWCAVVWLVWRGVPGAVWCEVPVVGWFGVVSLV